MHGEERNILAPLSQGRNADGNHVEPVVKILTESTLFESRTQIDVCCGDDSDVHTAGQVRTEPLKLPLLQNTQQLYLNIARNIADLIEESRTSVGLLKLTGFRRRCARERSL